MRLSNGPIAIDLQILLRYFDGPPFPPSAKVFPNNLPLYLENLKALL